MSEYQVTVMTARWLTAKGMVRVDVTDPIRTDDDSKVSVLVKVYVDDSGSNPKLLDRFTISVPADKIHRVFRKVESKYPPAF